MTHALAGLARTLIAAAAMLSTAAFAGPIEEANKQLVLEFQAVVLNGKDADAAPKYVVENYIQHNPRVADGLAALQGFVREMKHSGSEASGTIKRIVAEGDMVVIHTHFKRTAVDRGSALVDFFRIKDGKIVEHWDVVQPIPETSANSNSMF
ncbi:MAG: polyketide cyclase [Ramlibacter sp.]|nr:polyketide cyclase [Ramlibacter sp.]